MRIDVAVCQVCGERVESSVRAVLEARGWRSLLVGTDEYWLCSRHAAPHRRPPQQAREGEEG